HATVVGSAEETTVDLEIAPGVRTRWLRVAIREKITDDTDESAAATASLVPPIDGSTSTDSS
ncbi:MAG: preprotein translocase subunit YajC, partial [Mycobacteriales bacterium]